MNVKYCPSQTKNKTDPIAITGPVFYSIINLKSVPVVNRNRAGGSDLLGAH